MADAPTRGIVRTRLPYTGITAVDAGFTIIAQQVSQVATEIDALHDTVDGDGTPTAPTNNPAPTGISVVTNSDGSMDVALTWNYTDGTVPADYLVLFWKQGTAALAAPTAADKALLLAATARAFTFQGWNPNSNYRFGIAAGAKSTVTSAVIVGTILSPTAAPDWADVSATGNYTAAINGTPAVTVTANAANGQTAYTGTANYRTAGAPSTLPMPAVLVTGTDSDGSARYTVYWNYNQGALIADGFFFFVKEGDTASFVLTDPHFELGAQPAGLFTVAITLKGYPSDRAVSFGVAAFRRTEIGLEIGTITTSAAAPDWQGVTTGTPNYAGTIYGLEQHNFTVHAGGVGVLDTSQRYARVTRDGAVLQSGVRSYNLYVWDPAAQAAVFSQTYDLFAQEVWANTLARDIAIYNGRRLGVAFNFPSTLANNYLYGKMNWVSALPLPADATVLYLVYDIMWLESNAQIAVDLVCSDGVTALRDSGRTDQNGYNCHPSTAIPDGLILGVWYRRRIQLPASFNGKTISDFIIGCEHNAAGGHHARVRGIMISGADTRDPCSHPIWIGYTEVLSTSTSTNADAANTWGVVLENFPERATDILIVSTLDEPQAYRLTGSLTGALVAMGGSQTLLTSSAFQFGSAYCLVGTANCGEGNGLQRYAGEVPSDQSAFVDLTFQTQGSRIVALTGTGFQPSLAPGLPTNLPVPAAVSVVAKDTGTDIITINWTYTQPSLTGENRLADGFVVAVKSGNTADVSTSPNGKYKMSLDAREFVMESPLNQQWSFAVAAFRRTSNGEEIGNYVTASAAPDWQGIGGVSRVVENGIEDDSLSTNKYKNASITDAKVSNLSAAKITTGLLTVNPTSSGATGIFVDNAGKIRLKSMSSTPSVISFENTSGVERATIKGDSSGTLLLTSTGGNGVVLDGGTGAILLTAVTQTIGAGSGGVSISSTTGGVTLAGPASTSMQMASGGITLSGGTYIAGQPWFDVTTTASIGSLAGYMIVRNVVGSAQYKVALYNL